MLGKIHMHVPAHPSINSSIPPSINSIHPSHLPGHPAGGEIGYSFYLISAFITNCFYLGVKVGVEGIIHVVHILHSTIISHNNNIVDYKLNQLNIAHLPVDELREAPITTKMLLR